jgi:hypothetical protein
LIYLVRGCFFFVYSVFFKYKKGSDSVLVVNQDNYNTCNKKNPIKKLEDGDSEFSFDKSGPFFFITGKDQNCEKGQKLTVVVLAVWHYRQNPLLSAMASELCESLVHFSWRMQL